jgi:hypothetical protein
MIAENTISHSTVGKYVRMFVLSTKGTDIHIIPESAGDFWLDGRIALVLSKQPFRSAHQIAEKAMMSTSTAYRHLVQTIRRKPWHLKRSLTV